MPTDCIRQGRGKARFLYIGKMHKIGENMKYVCGSIRNIIYLSAMFLCLTMASYCYADSASVKIICDGGGSVDVVIRNISNNQPAQNGLITWSSVNAGHTGWKIADQYIEISHSGLPQSWGIQIYTDNKNETADPKYTGTANPAGLVKTDNTIFSLPMAWRIADSTIADPVVPVQRPNDLGFSDYMWHFLKDKNTIDDPVTLPNEAFQNGDDYVTLWNQAGIAWNEGGRSGNPKKSFIYLAANFTMSSVEAVYKTSALTIEAYEGISPFPIYLYKDAPLTDWPNEQGATLENHFAPSGWYNYDNSHKIITVNSKCKEVTPYQGTHCFKIHYNGNNGADGSKWGGIMWLEPSDIWSYSGNSPTHNGYDLRGANWIILRARTDSSNSGMQIKVGFGNMWDSARASIMWRSPALTTSWQRYIIPLAGLDLSEITGGIAVIFAADHEPSPDGCTIYLDDIKFSTALD